MYKNFKNQKILFSVERLLRERERESRDDSMLGGAGICGALGYLLQRALTERLRSGGDETNQHDLTDRLYKDLNENGGTRVAEIYGKTYVRSFCLILLIL